MYYLFVSLVCLSVHCSSFSHFLFAFYYVIRFSCLIMLLCLIKLFDCAVSLCHSLHTFYNLFVSRKFLILAFSVTHFKVIPLFFDINKKFGFQPNTNVYLLRFSYVFCHMLDHQAFLLKTYKSKGKRLPNKYFK